MIKRLSTPCMAALMAGLSIMAGAAQAQAQAYPNRVVTFVVPFPPGGPTDTMARLVAQRLTTNLGQSFVVENKPGVAGLVGTQFVARATPDGYTIVLGGLTTQVLNRALYSKLPYDPEKDFTPVGLLGKLSYMLVASPSFPASNVQEVVKLIKEHPGQYNYGSPGGSGNTSHIATEMFKKAAGGLQIAQIPYTGDAQSLTALMAGDVQLQFAVPLTVLSHVQSGKVKAIATAAPERNPVVPDVPTFGEQGLPSVQAETWFSVLVPAATPAPIAETLNREINRALETPELKARFALLGVKPGGGSLTEIAAFMRDEYPQWAQRVKDSGASVN